MATKMRGKTLEQTKQLLAQDLSDSEIARQVGMCRQAISQWKQRLTPKEREEIAIISEAYRAQTAQKAMEAAAQGIDVLASVFSLRAANPESVKDAREIATSVKHLYECGALAAGVSTNNVDVRMDPALQSIIEQLANRNNIEAEPSTYTVDAEVL